MNKSSGHDIAIINPNWSAFVLLVTLLSVFNSVVALVSPSPDARLVVRMVNVAISVIL